MSVNKSHIRMGAPDRNSRSSEFGYYGQSNITQGLLISEAVQSDRIGDAIHDTLSINGMTTELTA